MLGIRAVGQQEWSRYREGKELTMGQAVKAKCYDCSGGYVDGAVDCEMKNCDLYPFHAYNPNKKKRAMSDAQKVALSNLHKVNKEVTSG